MVGVGEGYHQEERPVLIPRGPPTTHRPDWRCRWWNNIPPAPWYGLPAAPCNHGETGDRGRAALARPARPAAAIVRSLHRCWCRGAAHNRSGRSRRTGWGTGRLRSSSSQGARIGIRRSPDPSGSRPKFRGRRGEAFPLNRLALVLGREIAHVLQVALADQGGVVARRTHDLDEGYLIHVQRDPQRAHPMAGGHPAGHQAGPVGHAHGRCDIETLEPHAFGGHRIDMGVLRLGWP